MLHANFYNFLMGLDPEEKRKIETGRTKE